LPRQYRSLAGECAKTADATHQAAETCRTRERAACCSWTPPCTTLAHLVQQCRLNQTWPRWTLRRPETRRSPKRRQSISCLLRPSCRSHRDVFRSDPDIVSALTASRLAEPYCRRSEAPEQNCVDTDEEKFPVGPSRLHGGDSRSSRPSAQSGHSGSGQASQG